MLHNTMQHTTCIDWNAYPSIHPYAHKPIHPYAHTSIHLYTNTEFHAYILTTSLNTCLHATTIETDVKHVPKTSTCQRMHKFRETQSEASRLMLQAARVVCAPQLSQADRLPWGVTASKSGDTDMPTSEIRRDCFNGS